MAELDIVDEEDKIVGKADFEEVHKRGLRHRSVQVFIFQTKHLDDLLIAERSPKQEVSKLKLHPSAAGHVKLGQTYLDAALDELREELFFREKELPSGISVIEVAGYKNDSRPTNKENTRLFYAVHQGSFSIDEQEIRVIYWEKREKIWDNMNKNPNKYTFTFVNAMKEFKKFMGEIKND